MGAEFVYLDFEESQADGIPPLGWLRFCDSSPEFAESEQHGPSFRELAPES